jgi:hypothetical protein
MHPQKPTHKSPTRVHVGSAIVSSNFLYINNIQLAFSQSVVVELWIFGVVKLDLYEWN